MRAPPRLYFFRSHRKAHHARYQITLLQFQVPAQIPPSRLMCHCIFADQVYVSYWCATELGGGPTQTGPICDSFIIGSYFFYSMSTASCRIISVSSFCFNLYMYQVLLYVFYKKLKQHVSCEFNIPGTIIYDVIDFDTLLNV